MAISVIFILHFHSIRKSFEFHMFSIYCFYAICLLIRKSIKCVFIIIKVRRKLKRDLKIKRRGKRVKLILQ